MKTAWLPEMPINVATLLLDPRLATQSDAKIGRIIRVLARAWITGGLTEVPASVRPVVESIWPEYDELRRKLHEKHRALSEAGSRGGRPPKEREALKPSESQALSEAESTHPYPHPHPNPNPHPLSKPETTLTPEILSPDKPARETWITPYCEAWSERTGGEMVVERALRPLAKLRKAHGDHVVLDAWERYLAQTEVRFCSVTHFASKFGEWSGSAGPPRAREFEIAAEIAAEGDIDPFMAQKAVRLLS